MNIPDPVRQKALQIKAIITDIDGVLTDGSIVYCEEQTECKHFNVKDGQIVSILLQADFIVGAISGRKSKSVRRRLEELHFSFIYSGIHNKIEIYNEIKSRYGLTDSDIAYIGDDINDLSLLGRCGLAIVPSDAREYIKSYADYITPAKGGEGAFRDAADVILSSQGRMDKILKNWSGQDEI